MGFPAVPAGAGILRKTAGRAKSIAANPEITLKKKLFSLPSISLRSLNKIEDAFLVVENASILGDKGRLIQYLKINKEEAPLKNTGNYCFFKGRVGIDNT